MPQNERKARMNSGTKKPEAATDEAAPVEPVVMPEVAGYVTYGVRVICPHCDKALHLNQYPYDDERTEYSLPEDDLGLAVFGSETIPTTWNGFSIEYKCCGCNKSFQLTQLEY